MLDHVPLPATGTCTVYYDAELSDLQLRVSLGGVKSFGFVRKIFGRTVRVTLGGCPAITIYQVRQSEFNSTITWFEFGRGATRGFWELTCLLMDQ